MLCCSCGRGGGGRPGARWAERGLGEPPSAPGLAACQPVVAGWPDATAAGILQARCCCCCCCCCCCWTRWWWIAEAPARRAAGHLRAAGGRGTVHQHTQHGVILRDGSARAARVRHDRQALALVSPRLPLLDTACPCSPPPAARAACHVHHACWPTLCVCKLSHSARVRRLALLLLLLLLLLQSSRWRRSESGTRTC